MIQRVGYDLIVTGNGMGSEWSRHCELSFPIPSFLRCIIFWRLPFPLLWILIKFEFKAIRGFDAPGNYILLNFYCNPVLLLRCISLVKTTSNASLLMVVEENNA